MNRRRAVNNQEGSSRKRLNAKLRFPPYFHAIVGYKSKGELLNRNDRKVMKDQVLRIYQQAKALIDD